MCSPTSCHACSKTTWAGCGSHVEQVMARVPKAQQCRCSDAEKAAAKPPSMMQRFRNR